MYGNINISPFSFVVLTIVDSLWQERERHRVENPLLNVHFCGLVKAIKLWYTSAWLLTLAVKSNGLIDSRLTAQYPGAKYFRPMYDGVIYQKI